MTAAAAAEGVAESASLFRRAFGVPPSSIASAAARVNLIGEHTDYNGGEVLPIAIARRTVVSVAASSTGRVRAVSTLESAPGEFSLDQARRDSSWWDYVHGVAEKLRERGIRVPGFNIAVWSDVPERAGLSSSAALEVATALALDEMLGTELPRRELALVGQRAEVEFVGVECGIMDQFASALGAEGAALHVWCDTTDTEHVPMPSAVLIFDTGVSRSLRGSAYNVRRSECRAALELLREHVPDLPHLTAATTDLLRDARLPQPLARRALHVLSETQRVRATVDVLRAGGTIPGDLMLASHESLRDNYECSIAELDWFVEHAIRYEGIVGARLTGAGWGGCAIAGGDESALRAAAPALASQYGRVFGRAPRWWLTTAAAGARVEPAP